MKNNYSFKSLLEKDPYDLIDKNELFFKMRNLTMDGNIYHLDGIKEIEKDLNDEFYFIIHNIVSYKGNTPFLKGLFFITSKQSLVNFLEKSIEVDDLRNLLISPKFKDEPRYVIQINDGAFYLYK
ncbi:hypothetical protein EXT68_11040 [Pectobacterium parmentieri]|uniref:Uncharacterized protein n=1 Tax=Pectobacterium parmentieri TaxID=1905730 RepID=A0A0H3I486_PECPM|nr:hypothetical protein [Pectobacterium parmentieri]ACX86351.1 hypothetical protein Pecwa_0515 [Pectobacterium parmentieri WPP163]AFI88665.1 Hypothetical protein W5S_0539 [Pectobacterium parmentieri]AOR60347.1 hypothetical protein A8F97_15820 [Pectobacterium parmentieri]AYG99947.1 hypothetical protein C5E26_02685 [Pectobacterium parmentieri]AYH04430.1 hypothetical protein C5E25_03055 [Pectobacterium parmentieri]